MQVRLSMDQKREAARLRKQKQRQKIKSSPELLAAEKEKGRKAYHKRKCLGKIVSITDMAPEQQAAQRKKWRDKKKRQRQKRYSCYLCFRSREYKIYTY